MREGIRRGLRDSRRHARRVRQYHLSRDKGLSYGGVNDIFTALRSSLNKRKHYEESHTRIREEEEKLTFDSMPSMTA